MQHSVPFALAGELAAMFPDLRSNSAAPNLIFVDPKTYENMSDVRKLSSYYVVLDPGSDNLVPYLVTYIDSKEAIEYVQGKWSQRSTADYSNVRPIHADTSRCR